MAETRIGTPGWPPLTWVARAVLVAIGLWALASMVWLGRDIIIIAFFAVLVALFLSLFVEPLVRHGAPRGLAVSLVLLVLLALVALFVTQTWTLLREQGQLLQRQLPAVVDRVEDLVVAQADALGGEIADSPAVERDLRARARGEMVRLIGGTLPLLNTALGFLTAIALVIASAAFLVVEPRVYVAGLVRLVPRSRRERVRDVLPIAGRALRQWIKGTALGMLIIGVFTTAGLYLIGLPAALLLGLIAGLLEFIPYIGPTVSFVPALAVGIAEGRVLPVMLLYGTLQFFESWLIQPLLMRGIVRLAPALTLLFQSLMAVLFGLLGLVLAVPLLAFAKVLVNELYVEPVADQA